MTIRINIAVAALALFVSASVAAAADPPATSDSGGSSVLTPFAALSPEAQSLGGEGEAMDVDEDLNDEDAGSVGAPVSSTEFPAVESNVSPSAASGGSASPGGEAKASGAVVVGGASIASVASLAGAVAGYFMF